MFRFLVLFLVLVTTSVYAEPFNVVHKKEFDECRAIKAKMDEKLATVQTQTLSEIAANLQERREFRDVPECAVKRVIKKEEEARKNRPANPGR